MSDTQHSTEAKRDMSVERRVQQSAEAMTMYAMNRDTSLAAGMRASMSNSLNEGHISGGAHGSDRNAFADNVRDEAAERDRSRPMAGYEDEIVSRQGFDSKYLNPTMTNDAFAATQDKGQEFAVQQDTQGRDAGRGAQAAFAAASLGDTPRDLDQHTAKSAKEGILGDANPLTGKQPPAMGGAGGGMAAALSQAKESGAIGSLGKAGVSMGGGNSMFGDSGKSLHAPSTPGQQEFSASKASSMLPSR